MNFLQLLLPVLCDYTGPARWRRRGRGRAAKGTPSRDMRKIRRKSAGYQEWRDMQMMRYLGLAEGRRRFTNSQQPLDELGTTTSFFSRGCLVWDTSLCCPHFLFHLCASFLFYPLQIRDRPRRDAFSRIHPFLDGDVRYLRWILISCNPIASPWEKKVDKTMIRDFFRSGHHRGTDVIPYQPI